MGQASSSANFFRYGYLGLTGLCVCTGGQAGPITFNAVLDTHTLCAVVGGGSLSLQRGRGGINSMTSLQTFTL